MRNHRPFFISVELIIYTLATWRLSHLLVKEDGPYDMLTRLRDLAGVRIDDVGNLYGTNVVAEALLCVWCLSVWIGVLWALLYYLIPGLAFWLALPLALSAGAVIIDEVILWLEHRS